MHPEKDLEQRIIDALSVSVATSIDNSIMGTHNSTATEIWTSTQHQRQQMIKDSQREWQKQMLNDWQEVRKNEEPLRQILRELDDMKRAMRKVSILLDSDLPDEEVFERFRMLREAYRKYKMVENLVLGQDKQEKK